jgi:hypothetical protein
VVVGIVCKDNSGLGHGLEGMGRVEEAADATAFVMSEPYITGTAPLYH